MKSYVFAVLLLLVSVVPASASAAATPPPGTGYEKATFAGGCFWCMEPPFIDLPGVVSVTSGYTGGQRADPDYNQVSAGITGHAEAVEIVFDPKRIGYQRLLDIFWRNIDPTVKDRQFCDTGDQYRTEIFTHSAEQQRLAQASLDTLGRDPRFAGRTLYTRITVAGPFYAAEEYHQQYFRKNPVRYNYYRWNCGRDQRLKEIWGSAPAGH